MKRKTAFVLTVTASVLFGASTLGADLIPPAGQIRKDRPRLLLRPKATPHAISLAQLKAIPRDKDFDTMLAHLRTLKGNAACQALVHLLTGEKEPAEKALERMRKWKLPDTKSKNNPFRVYFGCKEMALAYDWLHNYPGFTNELKAEVRRKVLPLAQAGNRADHIFHNYTWMWNSGAMLWALAVLGEDPAADKLYADVRDRLNTRLYPGVAYLKGQPADAQGYWALYCLAPGVITLMAAQSAFELDLAGQVKKDHGDWITGQLHNIVHTALPDMRYVPFGDMQGGGDGGVMHETACNVDQMTWATASPRGASFSRWLAAKRGARRFYGETAMFYFLYTRNLNVKPTAPPLDRLSGGPRGGHFLARSGWDDGDTVVGFRCTDHYTGHNHLDQGSFIIYRKGLLALDTGVYRRPRGHQFKTASHNTLLFGGVGQRWVRARANNTLESYKNALRPGKRSFETGNILFHKSTPDWAAVAGEFSQAYDAAVVKSAVRQLLFVRAGTIVIADHIAAPEGKRLPEVSWLLHVPSEPTVDKNTVLTDNGRAWLRCRALIPGGVTPDVKPGHRTIRTYRKKGETWCVTYRYAGREKLTLVHVIEVGDGKAAAKGMKVRTRSAEGSIVLSWAKETFTLSTKPPFSVSSGRPR